MTQRKLPSIAIIGVSALFPGMTDSDLGAGKFWRDIYGGRDMIREVPEKRWRVDDYFDEDKSRRGKTYAKRGAFLNDISFDSMTYGVPPKVLEATDTSQLLALIVAQQVLEDALLGGVGGVDASNRDKMSVILGVTAGQELMNEMASSLERPIWQKSLREAGLPEAMVQEACDRIEAHYTKWEESTFPGLLGNVVAGRIANRFNLGGTNCVTDAACASALSALHLAVNELYLGDSDVVITGGVDTFNDIFMYMCFSKTPALSETGDCRPFSSDADGTILGEGLAMFALKRMEDAVRDHDPIYASIEGVGTSSDGRSKSIYAPVSAGQAKAIRRAYEHANYPPSTVGLIEAHGTGTKAGDVAEFGGLCEAFGEDPETKKRSIALGSIKSQIGHTKASAGAAGLFKIVMAVANKTLPGTIKVDKPNPKLSIEDSPFYLNTYTRPWISKYPRRAGVSSFGFGGSNFHVTIQEPPKDVAAKRFHSWETHLLLITADSIEEVVDHLDKMEKTVGDSDIALYQAARQSHSSYNPSAKYRLGFTTRVGELNERIRQSKQVIKSYAEKSFSHPAGIHWGVGESAFADTDGRKKIAFLFPGQGSQYLDMGKTLALSFNDAIETWDLLATDNWEWDEASSEQSETTLYDVVFPKPVFSEAAAKQNEDRLRQTEWAQPALGVTSLATFNLMKSLGIQADAYAGHSFGEVTALAAAGVVSQKTAIHIARARGVLMRDAAAGQDGAMTAVKASSETLQKYLTDDVVIANDNSATQTVLSGTTTAIQAVEDALQKDQIKFTRLNVATAFHSPIVSGSIKPFANILGTMEFSNVGADVWSNVTAKPYPRGDQKEAVIEQLSGAIAQQVRFREMIEGMVDDGVQLFIEVGSQGVLTRLVDQIAPSAIAVATDSAEDDGISRFFNMLAVLVKEGVPFNPSILDRDYKEEAHNKDKKGLQIAISGGNYNKPYPPKDPKTIPGPNPPHALNPLLNHSGATSVDQKIVEPTKTNHQKVINNNTLRADRSMSEGNHTHHSNTFYSSETEHQTGQPHSPVPPTSPQRTIAPEWFHAFQEGQRQMAAAHAAYQDAMAQSHIAFLKAVETTQHSLMHMISGRSVAVGPVVAPPISAPQPASVPQSVTPQPVPLQPVHPQHAEPYQPKHPLNQSFTSRFEAATPATPPMAPPSPVAHVPAPASWMSMAQPSFAPSDTTAPQAPVVEQKPPTHQPKEQENQSVSDSSSDKTLEQVLLDTVADKTGYPAEMLDMGMKLEADLGIDSIKRVEILSSVTDAYPNLPEIDTGRMAELSTLGQILDYLSEGQKKKKVFRDLDTPTHDPVVDPAPLSTKEALRQDPELVEEVIDQLLLNQSVTAGFAANVTRWVVRSSETDIETIPEALGMTQVHLIPDGFGFSDHVADELRSKGIRVEIVLKGKDIPADAETVVYMKGAQIFYDLDDAVAINDDLFEAAKCIANTMTERGGTFITVQNTGGSFGFVNKISDFQAASAGAPALLKTASHEWPLANVKSIDIDLPENAGLHPEIAANIANEICRACGPVEVGLVGDQRLTFDVVATEPVRDLSTDLPPLELGPNDVVLASGGARGVTSACLLELARRCRSKFILLGRTPLEDESPRVSEAKTDAEIKKAIILDAQQKGELVKPNDVGRRARAVLAGREIRENLKQFKELGAQAVYLSVDVRNVTSIGDALLQLDPDWRRISVLVHGAGVIADKRIADKTLQQFDDVFATKINGFYALHTVVSSEHLKAIVFFSSAAARSGNQGQSDYAMANEVLNKIAQSLHVKNPDLRVKSMGWGPWRGGMVNDSLEHFFEHKGVELIELADGAAAFADELLYGDGEVEVCFGEVDFGGVDEDEAEVEYQPAAESVSLIKPCSLEAYPWLEDHSVKGDPIIPMVGVMDWMMALGEKMFTDVVAWRFDQVSIRQGIRIPKGAEMAFKVTGDYIVSNGGMACEVINEKTASVHYRASLRPVDRVVGSGRFSARKLEEWRKTIYDGEALFHEGVFQTLDAVFNVREHCIFGVLRDLDYAEERIGKAGPRLVALDACLQLVLLWIKANMNGIALPMSMEMATISNELWPKEGLKISATIEHRGAKHAKASAEVQDEEGKTLAVLKGIQSYIY